MPLIPIKLEPACAEFEDRPGKFYSCVIIDGVEKINEEQVFSSKEEAIEYSNRLIDAFEESLIHILPSEGGKQ